MFKYVTDVSSLSQSIIKEYCSNFNIAIDATLGNGYDTNFLGEKFQKVYAFDIQKSAVENYRSKDIKNVMLIEDSHSNFKLHINEGIDCIMYNLGFLPGGDKNVTTKCDSTIESINYGLEILNSGGIMTIAIYVGHEEGKKENDAILNLVTNLPKNKYGVMLHTFLNRSNNPPILVVVEKK